MHASAISNCKSFFEVYAGPFRNALPVTVIEIGSQDVNGSIRVTCPAEFKYIGVDFAATRGVDVVLQDPYVLPFPDESADIVLSSSCFEHSEMFWLVFLEILRILKPGGLFYLNAPSNGNFHRFPVDCWRFYPDSGRALVRWARRNAIPCVMLESFTSQQDNDVWNDFVAVFLKDEKHLANFPRRMLDTRQDVNNGLTNRSDEVLHLALLPEDARKLVAIQQITNNQIRIR